MKFKTITLLLFITCFFTLKAQENNSLPSTLNEQFDALYRKSSSYQIYKVISKEKYRGLQQNVNDSINLLKKTISQKEAQLKVNSSEVVKVKKNLSKLEQDLKISITKEDTISLFGISLSKTSYNLILLSIIAILISGLGYFVFKFFRSNQITKEAQQNLIEVEKEFETHKKKSLEREQKLRRKLQDEINKQRNS